MAIGTGTALALGGGAILGSVLGSQASKSAANTAADASRYGADQSAEVQRYMFDKMLELQQPYISAGTKALPSLATATPEGQMQKYATQLENLPSLSLPDLNLGQFSYNLDPNDPAYQFKLSESQKAIDAATAARGNYNSRAGINQISDAQRAITADEVTSQFNRAKDIYGLNTSADLSNYQAAYQKAGDTYSSGYGKATDLYNMGSQIGSLDYQKLLDLVKIGSGASSTAGSGALATGQGLANTYGNLGSSLANTELMKGQSQSDLWSGLGSTPLNYMLMSKLMA